VLARAWQATGDDRFPECFWRWLEDWMDKNPPNTGPNWKCGQEASMRLFAAAFAAEVFRCHASATPERMARLSRLAHATGDRVAAHIGYAISQDNNHGVSEAVGLITAGALWPTLPGAEQWLGEGMETLVRLCDRLIAADGSFSQHSSNYHRVMLDDLCFAEAVVRRAGLGLSDEVREAGRRAAAFLHQLMVSDGSVMRYGSDDGARVIQLSECRYGDYRPTLAACALFFRGPDPGPGPWQEQADQLNAFSGGFGPGVSPGRTPADPAILREPPGGIHIRRRGAATLLFRAPTQFRFRPGHADHLHVSVHDGNEFLTADPGSLSYNDPAKPWAGFSAARFHNVPTVDQDNPMEHASRFLWLPWIPCRLEVNEPDRLVASFEGVNHFLYRREVQIRAQLISPSAGTAAIVPPSRPLPCPAATPPPRNTGTTTTNSRASASTPLPTITRNQHGAANSASTPAPPASAQSSAGSLPTWHKRPLKNQSRQRIRNPKWFDDPLPRGLGTGSPEGGRLDPPRAGGFIQESLLAPQSKVSSFFFVLARLVK
jgi:hypothetical protein